MLSRWVIIISLIVWAGIASAQTNTFVASQGTITAIQTQLNQLQSELNGLILPPGIVAGDFVVGNAAATAYVSVPISGDISCSSSTPGNCTVVGLSGNPLTIKNIIGNTSGGPYSISNLNYFEGNLIDLETFGAKYDLRSNGPSQDLGCTNGQSTCTSASLNFTSADVGKDLIIVGPPPAWQANTAYTQGAVVLPTSQNAANLFMRNVFPGTSGASMPVPTAWATATWYEGPFYDCVTGSGHTQCLNAHGGQSGTSTPSWSVSGSTATDNTLTWLDEGTSTWPQCQGCLSKDGTATWITSGTSANTVPNVVATFVGCVAGVTNSTTISIGSWSGSSCVAVNYPGTTQTGMFAALQTDDTTAFDNAIDSLQKTQGDSALAGGGIRISGFIAINNTINPEAAGIDIECPGASGNPASNPTTGAGIIWYGIANGPMFKFQSRWNRMDGCLLIGNSYASSQPTAYIDINQHLSPFGGVSFNDFERNGDPQGTGSTGWPDVFAPQSNDAILIENTTQSDRNWFKGNAWGREARACFAQLNPQSISIDYDDDTCFQTPLGVYQPNGGDTIVNRNQMLAVGQEIWGGTGHIVVNDLAEQDSNNGPIPHQLAYLANNGAGGGYIEFHQSNGTGISAPATLPRVSGTIWGHAFNPGALVDTDASEGTLIMDANIEAPTDGFAYQGYFSGGINNPWRINLPSFQGTVDLAGSQGIGQNNLTVSSPTGFCTYFRDAVHYPFTQAPFQYGFSVLCNGASAVVGNFDLVGNATVRGGPLVLKQLVAPTLSTKTCTAGGSNYYYEVTLSNAPCSAVTGLPVAGTESSASSELSATSCTTPSVTTPITFQLTPAVGTIGALSVGIYRGTSSGGEVGYDCQDVQMNTSPGFVPTNWKYLDLGIGVGGGGSPPTITYVNNPSLVIPGLAQYPSPQITPIAGLPSCTAGLSGLTNFYVNNAASCSWWATPAATATTTLDCPVRCAPDGSWRMAN